MRPSYVFQNTANGLLKGMLLQHKMCPFCSKNIIFVWIGCMADVSLSGAVHYCKSMIPLV